MGDPKKPRKKWEGPKHPWKKDRLMEEMELLGKYGLRNKKEIWKAKTFLAKIRHRARSLLALPPEIREKAEKELLHRLYEMGLLPENATLDDVLSLTVENILDRRLQTIVYKKGLAKSLAHARQLIVHRHIAINGRIVNAPGYLVKRHEEDLIDYAPTSPYYTRRLEQIQGQT